MLTYCDAGNCRRCRKCRNTGKRENGKKCLKKVWFGNSWVVVNGKEVSCKNSKEKCTDQRSKKRQCEGGCEKRHPMGHDYQEPIIAKGVTLEPDETLNNGLEDPLLSLLEGERNDATDPEGVVNKVVETLINGLKELRNEATHPVGVFNRVFETLNNKGEVNVNVNVNGLKDERNDATDPEEVLNNWGEAK